MTMRPADYAAISKHTAGHDKTIYLACIGWIALDAAIVAGVIVHA
jgi:hypothetical protein